MIPHPKAWLAFLLLVLLAGLGFTSGGDPDSSGDEKTLKEAQIDTSGPGLLEFFRRRIVTAEERGRAGDLIRRLGNDTFEVREKASRDLEALGDPVVPLLVKAQNDPDPEIRRRVEECLEAIQQGTQLPLLVAAAQVLARRKPTAAAPVLLAYLPSSPDEVVTASILEALEQVRLRDGQIDPVLLAALTDPEPARRAAAAQVLGKTSPEHRVAVKGLFNDPDVSVRVLAASTLAQSGDKTTLPVLIALLQDAPADLAWQTEYLLGRIAGEKSPSATLSAGLDTPNRHKCQEAWRAWWDANKDQVDLSRLGREEREVGVKVVCELEGGAQSGGRVFELGPDDRIRWQFENVAGPIDVQLLPNGHVLLAEINANRVTERDRTGKIYFEKKLGDSPMTCQRLLNGNTFIATYTEVLEVNRDGQMVYSYPRPGHRIYCAQKLANGHILYVNNGGSLVELSSEGKELRSISAGDTSNWGSVEALPNGNFLVSRCSVHEVVEIDAGGKVVWRCEAQWPTWACKRPNGRVMVACAHSGQVLEFDRAGKEVWKQKLTGRPCRVRRY